MSTSLQLQPQPVPKNNPKQEKKTIHKENTRRKKKIINAGKTQSNSRTELDELYKAFISCEPNCAICDKYILDFSQHFKLIHTHSPTAENHDKNLQDSRQYSDDVPLQFCVTEKLNKADSGIPRIIRPRKQKLIASVEDCVYDDHEIPSSDFNASHLSKRKRNPDVKSGTLLSKINTEESMAEKCRRSLRARKVVNYAEILNRNAEVENDESENKIIKMKSPETFSNTEKLQFDFVSVFEEDIKSEPEDQDQDIVIPKELNFDVVPGSTDQDNIADFDELEEDLNADAVEDDFLDNRDPLYTPMEENNESDFVDGDGKDYAQNPDKSDNNESVRRRRSRRRNADQGPVSQMHHCDHCTKNYFNLAELKKHLQECHDDLIEKPFVCTHCTEDVRFFTSLKLHAHVRSTHPGQKNYICSVCKKGFDWKRYLDEHFMKHTGDKPFECPHCKNGFRTKHKLTRHIIIHTQGKKFHCDYEQCGKSFCYEHQLNYHKRKHSAEKHTYMCDQCSKCFPSLGALNPHIMAVHGERAFVCEHCGKGFKIAKHLRLHVSIHTGQKPHQCELCGKSFRIRDLLKYHLKSTHGIDIKSLPLSSVAPK